MILWVLFFQNTAIFLFSRRVTSFYISLMLLLKFNNIMPPRFTSKVIPSIVNGSDVNYNLNSWQNLSLQLVYFTIHMSLVQEKFSFGPEYLANWKRCSVLFRCFSDLSRNITLSSEYCSKNRIPFPVFFYLSYFYFV